MGWPTTASVTSRLELPVLLGKGLERCECPEAPARSRAGIDGDNGRLISVVGIKRSRGEVGRLLNAEAPSTVVTDHSAFARSAQRTAWAHRYSGTPTNTRPSIRFPPLTRRSVLNVFCPRWPFS